MTRSDASCYIDVRYSLAATNDPRNLVFPFYVIPADERIAEHGAESSHGPARSEPR